ncbi:hypothetical protein [Caulobacter sp. DWR1-3-2b1]
MAYISFDQAPAAGRISRIAAPRLAWGRIGMLAFCLAFWVGLAFAVRAIF